MAVHSRLSLFLPIVAALLILNVQAQQCTENFKEVLTSDGSRRGSRSQTETRLFPTMRFTCKGTIVSYTVTGRDRNGGSDPKIQIWRENKAQCGFYYKPVNDITVESTTSCSSTTAVDSRITLCVLRTSAQVSVQPGDILGIELPPTNDDSFELYFTNGGPMNYIFRQSSTTSTIFELATRNSVAEEQPQITLDITSDQQCNNGREDVTSAGSGNGANFNVVTRLIPDLKFTCNGTITEITAGGAQRSGVQVPKIQIWRESPSQCGTYFKPVADISLNGSVCDGGVTTVSSNVYHCMLKAMFRVKLQQGDILGLELPPRNSDSFELFFTSGGPTNYVFQNQLSPGTDTPLSSRSSEVQEQPQINIVVETVLPTEMSTTTTSFDTTTAVLRTTTVPMNIESTSEPMDQRTTTVSQREVTTPGLSTTGSLTTTSGLTTKDSLTTKPGLTMTDDLSSTDTTDGSTTARSLTTTLSLEEVAQNSASGVPLQIVVIGSVVGIVVLAILIVLVILIYGMWLKNRKSVIFSSNGGVARNNEYPLTNPMYREPNVKSIENDMDIYETPIDDAFDYEDMDGNDCEPGSKAKAQPFKAANAHTTMPTRSVNDYSSTPGPTAHSNTGCNYDCLPPVPRPMAPATSGCDNSYYECPTPRPMALAATGCDNYKCPTPRPMVLAAAGAKYDHLPPKESVKDLYMNAPEEDDTYWEPANDVNELYHQLSTNKYRDIEPSQIRIIKVLGSGQFGEVSKGIWQSPMGAMDVAVKQLQSGASEEEKVKFLQEAAINGQFRHPNVVKLMGVVTGGGPFVKTMIVLELLSNGDLLNFLLKLRPRPGETVSLSTQQMVLRFCENVASGMNYLASKSFIHRDLAARNILVSDDKICKISDFGMSRDVEDENYYVSKGGKVPVKWTAPEALHYKKYSTASDVWSFGCVMYEIWSLGHKPFERFTNNETLRMIDKGYLLPPPPGMSKELYKIMIQCWKPESSRRPKFPQLVEMLSRAEFELFGWEEHDVNGMDPQVKVIGAPLEVAQNLYPELQKSYAS